MLNHATTHSRDRCQPFEMNRLDKLTDINFRLICQSKSKSVYFVNFVDENGEQLVGHIREQLAGYMAENGLIEIYGESCRLFHKSEHICESGWIKHLKVKEVGKLEQYTLKVLRKLKNGESIPNTKSESNEVSELLQKLRNLDILNLSSKNGYTILEGKRNGVKKLIELESFDDFLDWYDGQNTNGNTTNYFIGENKGIVNQSSNFSNSPQTNNTVATTQSTSQKNFIKKFWKLISENKLISSIILAIILYIVKLIFGIEL